MTQRNKPALIVRLLRVLLRGVHMSARSLRRREPHVIQTGNIVYGDMHAGSLDIPAYQRNPKKRKRET